MQRGVLQKARAFTKEGSTGAHRGGGEVRNRASWLQVESMCVLGQRQSSEFRVYLSQDKNRQAGWNIPISHSQGAALGQRRAPAC